MASNNPDQIPSLAESSFREYTVRLHRYLLRRLGRPADADDLAQEVFVRLLRLQKPELVRKPYSYLFSVAHNLVREFHLRSERDQDHVTFDSDVVDVAAEHPAQLLPDDLPERLHVRQQLERALTRLPRMQRAVILLVKRDGLSHEETAQRTGLNVRTVERYVIEATAKLATMDWDR